MAQSEGRQADVSGNPAVCGVAVMAKASAPGRTKTRLVPPLTPEEAASFNTAFLQDVAANLRAAGEQAAIAGYMAYGPPGSDAFFRGILSPDIGLIETWKPGFGDCLFFAIERMFALGHGSAVVLNSDSPTLPTSLLIGTARALSLPGDRAVLGPADDGGYYLLGLKQAHRPLFEGIAWSTEHVARQTLQRAEAIGLEVHVLPTWYDVDDRAAFHLLHGELFDGATFDRALTPHPAPHSRALMMSLLQTTDFAVRMALVKREVA